MEVNNYEIVFTERQTERERGQLSYDTQLVDRGAQTADKSARRLFCSTLKVGAQFMCSVNAA